MFYNLFFSPTGGTRKVAEILGDAMHVDQTIDFTPASVKLDSLQLTENDICLISVPSFGGRIPFSATDKLKTLKADSAKAILVRVCSAATRYGWSGILGSVRCQWCCR